MIILHLSDTHGAHHRLRELPYADVVVHSGDFCMVGEEREALDFLNWFCDLPYRHKIFICGNHDVCLYDANVNGLADNVYHLNNSGVEIDGIKFYGVPLPSLDDGSMRMARNYAAIPEDTDILVTHSPAYGIFDFDSGVNYGSKELLESVVRIYPIAHLFGHIHLQHGIMKQNGIIFSNGAIMNDDYSKLNKPNTIGI